MRVVGRRTSDMTLEPLPSAQAMRRGLAVVDAAATFGWTIDIDFLVEASIDNGTLVKQALLVLADRSAADIDPAWFTEGDNIRVADEVTVDMLFSPCAQTHDMLEPHACVIDFADRTSIDIMMRHAS